MPTVTHQWKSADRKTRSSDRLLILDQTCQRCGARRQLLTEIGGAVVTELSIDGRARAPKTCLPAQGERE